MSKPWTQEEEGMAIRLRRKDVSLDDIAEALGRSRRAVSKKLSELGFHQPRARRTVHADNVVTDPGKHIGPQYSEIRDRENKRSGSERLARATAAYILRYANDNRISDVEALNRLLYAGGAA